MRYTLFLFLFCFCGCSSPSLSDYRVQVISPSGKVVDTFVFENSTRPIIGTRWGGQTYAHSQNNNEIVYAPVGWMVLYEEIKKNK